MRADISALGRAWWCYGAGLAVLLLMVVVAVFRQPRDAVFWIAVGFLVAHVALTVVRYLNDRKSRVEVDVDRFEAVMLPYPTVHYSLKRVPGTPAQAVSANKKSVLTSNDGLVVNN